MIVTFEAFFTKPGEDKPAWHAIDSGHMKPKKARRKLARMRLHHPGRPLRLWKDGKEGMTLMKEYYANDTAD